MLILVEVIKGRKYLDGIIILLLLAQSSENHIPLLVFNPLCTMLFGRFASTHFIGICFAFSYFISGI